MPDLDFFWNAWSTCILKVSDEFTVPLCRAHHRELHRTGKETDWWSKMGIEPLGFARELWLGTRPLPGIQENSEAARP